MIKGAYRGFLCLRLALAATQEVCFLLQPSFEIFKNENSRLLSIRLQQQNSRPKNTGQLIQNSEIKCPEFSDRATN